METSPLIEPFVIVTALGAVFFFHLRQSRAARAARRRLETLARNAP